MGIVEVRDLAKIFRVHQKEPGLAGSVKSLVKRHYRDVRAVDGVSFEIEPGELIAFLGPNGAGKTTTLKLLSGLLRPTSGHITVLGMDPWKRSDTYRRQFALVMGQKNQLWWDLPAIETFNLNREIYGISKREFDATVGEMVDTLGLEGLLNRQVRKLSLGERMKCELVAALLHRPKVLYLDEPTIGLDVVMQQAIRQFVRDYNERHGATVILTSHYMQDIEAICRRVIVMDSGRVVFEGPLSKIQDRFARYRYLRLEFERPVDRSDLLRFGELTEYAGSTATLRAPKENSASVAAEVLRTMPVLDVTIEEPPIDEVIRQLFTAGSGPSAAPNAVPAN